MVTDSGKRHSLGVDGEYNKRRESCYAAAKKMGVVSLRHASLEQLQGRVFCVTKYSIAEFLEFETK